MATSTLDGVVPLPRTLQLLTLATLTLSFALFVLAMMDLATAGFFLVVGAAVATMMHDVTVILYSRRLYPNQAPIFFPPAAAGFNIIFLGVCAVIYFAATAMVSWSSATILDGDMSYGTPANSGTLLAQAVLSPICAILLLITAAWCWRSRSLGQQYGYGEF
ncbi:hypothetical protein K488DRAFT_89443 [Vararia minispora EC-137]|uniref:Uncharacterized protein n=1 Tax=Vararia minispora EC-137 TaxID=1314806 RepID=A0ACB8QBT8_9AGAM|nr:hypothetical protein K488DRAFT_89443 [Vararia minispora EC-137]